MKKKYDYLGEQGLTFVELSEDVKLELSVLRWFRYFYWCTYPRSSKSNPKDMWADENALW